MRKQAGYMAAPERFAQRQIPLALRAPSIHGPKRTWRNRWKVDRANWDGAMQKVPNVATVSMRGIHKACGC
jgi:hypothetical protein